MSVTIAAGALVHPGVSLGEGSVVEAQCILGSETAGPPTLIGAGALIRAQTVIYAGNRIGRGFRTGNKVNIREMNVIGDDVSIGTGSVVEHHVAIADSVRIHSMCFVPEFSEIGPGAWLGPGVFLTNARYPASARAKSRLVGPVLGARCRIGANSTILPGVRIGIGTLVGAGSVVTRDLPDGVVAYGNPASARRPISEIEDYDDETDPAR